MRLASLIVLLVGLVHARALSEPAPSSLESATFTSMLQQARGSLYSLFGFEASGGDSTVSVMQPKRPAQISSQDVAERVEVSQELISLGRVDEAMDVLLTVLEKEPEDRDAFLPNMLLGTALLTVKQRAGEATGFLYQAVALSNWTDASSIANLVAALSLDGDRALAQRVAMRGIAVAGPGSIYVLAQSLGRASEASGNFTGAAEWYLMAALNDSAQSAEPWIKASTMKFPAEHQRLDIAESVLLRAFPHHPNSAEILFLLASVLHRRDRIEQSLPIYRRAVSLDGGRRDVWAMYATALHSTARFDAALPAYATAVQLSPNNAVLMANYAICLCDPAVRRFGEGRAAVELARGISTDGAGAAGLEAPVGTADIATAAGMCGEGESAPAGQAREAAVSREGLSALET